MRLNFDFLKVVQCFLFVVLPEFAHAMPVYRMDEDLVETSGVRIRFPIHITAKPPIGYEWVPSSDRMRQLTHVLKATTHRGSLVRDFGGGNQIFDARTTEDISVPKNHAGGGYPINMDLGGLQLPNYPFSVQDYPQSQGLNWIHLQIPDDTRVFVVRGIYIPDQSFNQTLIGRAAFSLFNVDRVNPGDVRLKLSKKEGLNWIEIASYSAGFESHLRRKTHERWQLKAKMAETQESTEVMLELFVKKGLSLHDHMGLYDGALFGAVCNAGFVDVELCRGF